MRWYPDPLSASAPFIDYHPGAAQNSCQNWKTIAFAAILILLHAQFAALKKAADQTDPYVPRPGGWARQKRCQTTTLDKSWTNRTTFT